MNIHLTRPLEDYVRQRVADGGYNSASEFVREALRLMRDFEDIKRQYLRTMILEGEDAINRGDFKEVKTDDQLKELFGRL